MSFPDEQEVPALLDRWAKHYGYKSITLSPIKSDPVSVTLVYKTGMKFHIGGTDMETIRRKIVANKPK